MSSSVHIDNKNKGVLILAKGPTLAAGATEATVSYLLMLQKSKKSKQKTLCFSNILKYFTINNMKKNRIERNRKILFC